LCPLEVLPGIGVSVGKSGAPVIGMLREVDSVMGIVGVANDAEMVAGSSDGSSLSGSFGSSCSWGYGKAAANPTRAPTKRVMRILFTVEGIRSVDE
jgi:hypothetical protein